MSVDVPDVVDAWRMVAARRGFEARAPLSSMHRLRDLLNDADGDVNFSLEFDRDALQTAYVELRIETELPLLCQRSLRRFLQPVRVVQRLGLLPAGREEDEAALPEGYEPLMIPEDGAVRPIDLIEDELILAVPLIPICPGSELLEQSWPVSQEEEASSNPFSALSSLKQRTS